MEGRIRIASYSARGQERVRERRSRVRFDKAIGSSDLTAAIMAFAVVEVAGVISSASRKKNPALYAIDGRVLLDLTWELRQTSIERIALLRRSHLRPAQRAPEACIGAGWPPLSSSLSERHGREAPTPQHPPDARQEANVDRKRQNWLSSGIGTFARGYDV